MSITSARLPVWLTASIQLFVGRLNKESILDQFGFWTAATQHLQSQAHSGMLLLDCGRAVEVFAALLLSADDHGLADVALCGVLLTHLHMGHHLGLMQWVLLLRLCCCR
jgi:glyoxylase-like metal-dependent hydrolase (beta-lactamase superfamily II)